MWAASILLRYRFTLHSLKLLFDRSFRIGRNVEAYLFKPLYEFFIQCDGNFDLLQSDSSISRVLPSRYLAYREGERRDRN